MKDSLGAEHLSSFQRFSLGTDTGQGCCSLARRTIACSWTLLNWVWFRAAIMSCTCSTYLQNRVYSIICSHKLSIRVSLPLKRYSYLIATTIRVDLHVYQEWTKLNLESTATLNLTSSTLFLKPRPHAHFFFLLMRQNHLYASF